jgi:pyruvate/2-oxoglutarate dehydrogenase complex dihydrolipoamide dehydrogenase (E3) component
VILGVVLDANRAIQVNEHYPNLPSIYALGDGRPFQSDTDAAMALVNQLYSDQAYTC